MTSLRHIKFKKWDAIISQLSVLKTTVKLKLSWNFTNTSFHCCILHANLKALLFLCRDALWPHHTAPSGQCQRLHICQLSVWWSPHRPGILCQVGGCVPRRYWRCDQHRDFSWCKPWCTSLGTRSAPALLSFALRPNHFTFASTDWGAEYSGV